MEKGVDSGFWRALGDHHLSVVVDSRSFDTKVEVLRYDKVVHAWSTRYSAAMFRRHPSDLDAHQGRVIAVAALCALLYGSRTNFTNSSCRAAAPTSTMLSPMDWRPARRDRGRGSPAGEIGLNT